MSFQSKGGALQVCAGGQGVPFDEDLAKEVLGQDEVTILVTLTAGQGQLLLLGLRPHLRLCENQRRLPQLRPGGTHPWT